MKKNDGSVSVSTSVPALTGYLYVNGMCPVLYLAANDYLELFTFQYTGADATLIRSQATTFLTVKRLY